MLPAAMWWDGIIIGGVISLSMSSSTLKTPGHMTYMACQGRFFSHLDDGNYIGSSDGKLGHVDSKMIQAVPLGLQMDEVAAIAHGMDTA